MLLTVKKGSYICELGIFIEQYWTIISNINSTTIAYLQSAQHWPRSLDYRDNMDNLKDFMF